MSEAKRVEIGFAGGQVVSVRITDEALGALRKAAQKAGGWHELETDDGVITLALEKVVFVRSAGGSHTIGFAGD